ncbi:hypothetical protein QTP88_017899 [Uroleucon formosanum]
MEHDVCKRYASFILNSLYPFILLELTASIDNKLPVDVAVNHLFFWERGECPYNLIPPLQPTNPTCYNDVDN